MAINIKKFLEEGGTKVILPSKFDVKTFLQKGGTKGGDFVSGEGGSSYTESSTPQTPVSANVPQTPTPIQQAQADKFTQLAMRTAGSQQAFGRLSQSQPLTDVDVFNIRRTMGEFRNETGLGLASRQPLQEVVNSIPQSFLASRQPLQEVVNSIPQSFTAPTQLTQAKPYRQLGLKDVDIYASFQGGFPKQNKVTAQTLTEQRLRILFNTLGEKVLSKLPEGKIKGYLSKPTETRITDIVKFGALQPALETSLIQKELVNVPAKTKFLSVETPLEEGLIKVQTFAVQIKNPKTFLVAEDIVKAGEKSSLSLGRGYTITPTKSLGKEIEEFKTVGISKEMGKATRVLENPFFKLSREVGTGESAKILSQPQRTIIFERGLDITGKTQRLTQIKGLGMPQKEEITGLFKGISDDVFGFVGKTGKPTLRIYKSGEITKIIREPNVKGLVFRNRETTDIGESVFFPQTKTITKQVGALAVKESKVTQSIIKQIPIQKPLIPISKSSFEKPITVPMQKSSQFIRTITKLTPVLTQRERQRERQIISQIPRQEQSQNQQQKNIPSLAISQNQALKERQIPKVLFNLAQIQKQQQRFKSPLRVNFREGLIPKTKTPFAPIIPIINRNKIKLGGKSQERDLFSVEGRRRGKWFVLAKEPNFYKALSKGRGFAQTTLGASFKIRKGEQLIKIPKTRAFGTSKKNPFVAVQKRGFRLSSIPERREILLARRGVRFF